MLLVSFYYLKMQKTYYLLVIFHVKQCHEKDDAHAKEARASLGNSSRFRYLI